MLKLAKLISWLDCYNPFDLNENSLRSLSSGLTANLGDGINCDTAEEVGSKIHRQMDNLNVLDVSLKRSDHVHTLIKLKGITIRHQTVHLDNSHLFSRLTVLALRSENVSAYFQYELTAIPTSLFKEYCIRKAKKSTLAHFRSYPTNSSTICS